MHKYIQFVLQHIHVYRNRLFLPCPHYACALCAIQQFMSTYKATDTKGVFREVDRPTGWKDRR